MTCPMTASCVVSLIAIGVAMVQGGGFREATER